MNGYALPPSDGRDGDTHLEFFEQELVTALNDFAGTSPAPHFDATRIKSRTRRRRAGFIASVSAVLIVAAGGTALATVGTGSHAARSTAADATRTTATTTATTPARTPATTPSKRDTTLVPYVKPFSLRGMNLEMATEALGQAGLKVGTITHGVVDNCKPGSVIDVSPRYPRIVRPGGKVDLGLCG